MSELLRMVRSRVQDDLIAPVRRTMGPDTPAERTALEVLKIVEEAEHELAERWITLQEAVSVSGYSYDSLQRYAKAIHDGEAVSGPWSAMEVRKPDGQAYEVRAGSLPLKPGKAA